MIRVNCDGCGKEAEVKEAARTGSPEFPMLVMAWPPGWGSLSALAIEKVTNGARKVYPIVILACGESCVARAEESVNARVQQVPS